MAARLPAAGATVSVASGAAGAGRQKAQSRASAAVLGIGFLGMLTLGSVARRRGVHSALNLCNYIAIQL